MFHQRTAYYSQIWVVPIDMLFYFLVHLQLSVSVCSVDCVKSHQNVDLTTGEPN